MSFKLISFDGYDFNAAGYTIKPPQDSWRGQVGNTVPSSNRPGRLPTLGPASINARRLTYDVIPPSGTDANLAIETLITKLRPMDPVPRTLIAEHPDASGAPVQVQRQAVIEMPHGAPGDLSADIVRITFVSADPAWRVVSLPSAVTVATNHDSTSWNAGTAYTAVGSAPIPPIVTIDTNTPGSGSAPNRYSFTITNNRSYPLVKLPWLVNLGDTSGWSGSTAANTFLFCDGVEVPREVIAMGETRSYLLFTIDKIAQGQVKTYELLTGGTAPAIATTAQALSGRIKAPVPDFGWQVVTTTSAGTGTTTVTATGLSSGSPYATTPTDRWKGGYIVGLTGAAAGTDHQITANTSTTITTDIAFAAYASGSKFLVMASWLYSAGSQLYLNYAVRLTEHSDYPHGLWYEDVSQTKPGDIRYDSPASWEPARTFDNNDDVASKSVSPAVGDYFTTPNLYRTWAGGDDNSNIRERGSADSVVFSSQLPISSWTFDYAWKNPNGIARAVFGSRQSQAEDWTLNIEDVSSHSTLTDIAETTVTPVSETLFLMMGVWPLADYEEIPTSWRHDSGGRSGGGYTTMDDDTKNWPTDIWVGARWRVTSGKGQGQSRTITGNDANTLTWSSALPSDDVVPNDGSRYEVVNPSLIANLRTDDVFKVVLTISDVVTSSLTSLGAAERVSVRVRANGGASATTANVYIEVGVRRYLWVASGHTVVINCDAQTALVMNGSTVVKDITDWVRAYEVLADTPTVGTLFTGTAADWFPIQPGSGTFYTQRVLGVARHTATVQLITGYLG